MSFLHSLSPGGNTLVVLDACVLLPSRLSDVLFDLMLERLYFAYWTEKVEEEFLRNWPLVHPDAARSGEKRLDAFRRATGYGHMIYGHDSPFSLGRVPASVQVNDRHLVAAALVLADGLAEEDDPASHGVWIVSSNTKHLAVVDTRKLGIDVVKPGVFFR